jgi:hypothetical protein
MGPHVDQHRRLPRRRHLVGRLEGVLQRERHEVDHHGLQLRLARHGSEVAHDLLLGRHQEHLHLPIRRPRAEGLEVELDIILGKRNMSLGLDGDPGHELARRHRRHGDLLDDHRVPGDGQRHLAAPQAEACIERPHRLHHGALIHDRPVDDAVRRNRLDAEQLARAIAPTRQLGELHRTRAEIQTNACLGQSLPPLFPWPMALGRQQRASARPG